MKRFALCTLGLVVLASACNDGNRQPLSPEAGTAEARISAEAQGRQASIRQKQPAISTRSSAAPMSLVVQDLNTLTPEALAAALVGPGVTVSNVSYTGANRAAGTFAGGGGIIGFESGIILSSGCISNVIGPNEEPDITCVNNTPGDPDLNAISGQTTFDAAVLEFDFVPSTDRIFFQYVFASDEYNEFVGDIFNDAFGFFINGVNYAVVGDPPVPVTINTINQGQPDVEPTNPELYRSNDPFDPTFAGFLCPAGGCFDTEMDGLTVVLTFEAPVNPGVVNRMKLAIADAADRLFDSNVFIQAGTLAICPNPVPLAEVRSNGGPEGVISLSSTTTTVGILNVEAYLPVGPPAPQPSWVRFGPTPGNSTPAQGFSVADFDMDGNRDARVRWSTSQLVADGRLALGTQSITVWGIDDADNRLFCGVREVEVVP